MHHTIIQNDIKKPSCNDLVAYLDKETTLDKSESLAGKFTDYLDKESVLSGEDMNFFNTLEDDVDKFTVATSIDKNCRKLSRDEARFFSITIDPSAKEINHVKEIAGYTADNLIESGAPGTKEYIQEKVCREIFQDYARQCMDEYARNFNRENIKSGADLVWFGRVEKNRYWKSKSPEVQHNRAIFREIKKLKKNKMSPERDEFIAKLEQNLIREKDVREGGKDMPIVEMMPKSGDNYHIHVIVSRRDVRQQYKLSPLSKPTYNKEHIVGNRKCTIGFDRNRFANKIESVFDAKTGYERLNIERFEVLKEMKKERDKGNELTPFDLSQTNDHSTESECKDIESSLRETLPHCNSMQELQELPEEKGIVSVMEKDAENKNGREFHIDGSNKDELIFQQEQVLEDNHLSTPESKHFDLSQANDHDAQCKYIESSLRETLPRCNSMQELQEHLTEKGIVSRVDKNLNNEKDIYFYVDGCNQEEHTFRLKDVSSNLSYYGVENYVKREWKKSFFPPKIMDKEETRMPEHKPFDLSQKNNHDAQYKYVESSLRETLPYCNSMQELQELLMQRGVVSGEDRNLDNERDMYFYVDGSNREKHTFHLRNISSNLSYYDVENYVTREWKNYFYLPKEQSLEGDRLPMLEYKPFDLSQKNNHDAQCKYIESSLRETLPYCNSMQELQEYLTEKGIVSRVDKNLNNEKDIYFYVDGCNRSKHTFSLKDISPNLSYYGIENHVKKEWRKSFFAPRITDKEANPISLPTHFNEAVGKDKNKQSEYIDKTLRDVMPYCDSLKELQERLRIRDIKCDITYIKGKGKIVSFKITSLWNSKTFTSEEISPNLNYRELARYYKEGYSRQNQSNSYTHTYGDSYKAQVATRYVMNRLALESGLKYINKDIKPYRNSVALGVSGIRILVSDKTAREKTVAVAKRVANHFGYKLGFSVAPELMGAVSIVSGIKSLTKILGSDNGQEK